MGQGGFYFLPKNITMQQSNYNEVLKQHFIPFWSIHQCKYFMHKGKPTQRSMGTQKLFTDECIHVLEWASHFPDLNLMENAWKYMNGKAVQTNKINIHQLKQALKNFSELDLSYFPKLSKSMPERL